MKQLLLVAVVVAGLGINTSAFAAQKVDRFGYFGPVGSELGSRHPWNGMRGIRPTFGGDVSTELKAAQGPGTRLFSNARPSYHSQEARVQGSRTIGVRSAGERREVRRGPANVLSR